MRVERGKMGDARRRSVIVVGGGIAGLYCARELAKHGGYRVHVLEGTGRFGGRIETAELWGNRNKSPASFKAEFGPMRFELPLQPLFETLGDELGVTFTSFPPPSVADPPITFPLADDERNPRTDEPLDALELLKLGVYRMFGKNPEIDSNGMVRLLAADSAWLKSLRDDDGSFDDLRATAPMAGTNRPLYSIGLWNALSLVLSPLAVMKIMNLGTFYHLMPDNPNAVEWAIFWVRMFKLAEGEELSTIPAGVETVTKRMVAEFRGKWADRVELSHSHRVTAVRPAEDAESVAVDATDGGGGELTFTADHVVLAIPQTPALAITADFPPEIQADLRSVIAFPLLKVFLVTETPPWWDRPRLPQQDAWLAPTREVHYFPRNEVGENTMILLYTDRPATVFWQQYVLDRDQHRRAEVNANDELRDALAGLLFRMHFAWADGLIRRRRGGVTFPAGHRVHEILSELGEILELPDYEAMNDLERSVVGAHPALSKWPRTILLKPDEIKQWQRNALHDYAIRDWSCEPFGAGCHAWKPGAKSWEVRARLRAFGFADRPDPKNLHVCGEAYSDYQGFIEGALRTAKDAVEEIVAT